MAEAKAECRIGTSGYQYDHWRGVLYEKGLAKKDWFACYAQEFDTVEINNTFYHLPERETFDKWREQTPEGFVYSLKFSRYGSHLKRLKDPADSIGHFIDRAARLEGYLGPILVQLPPNWHADPERLENFLNEAPKAYRWVVEFRDRDWLKREIFDLLRAQQAALCIHDMIEDHPIEITADWVYLRFHGDHYRGSYSPQYLSAQADRIAEWVRDGKDVYVYFNNDEAGYAVQNARDLKRYLQRRLS